MKPDHFRISLLLPLLLSGRGMAFQADPVKALPSEAPAGEPTEGGQPLASFDHTTHSFGKIESNTLVHHAFKVTNRGKATLVILEVKASCGCTSALPMKQTLAPGESTEIQAQFNTQSFRGLVRKSITVRSNDPANPTINLHFDADVLPEPPPAVRRILMRDMERTEVRKTILRLDPVEGRPVHAKEVKSPGAPYLSAQLRGEGEDEFLEIQLDGRGLPAGKDAGTDTFLIVPEGIGKSAIPVEVRWELKAAVEAMPAVVAWVGKADAGHATTVRLNSLKGRSFRILEARASSAWLQVKLLKSGASRQPECRITISPSAQPGSYPGEFVILKLDDPDQAELRIRVSLLLQ